MRTLLMIASAFPPASEVGALRVAKLAAWLRDYGWESLVLTADPEGRTTARDESGRPALHISYDLAADVEVILIPAPNPVAIVGTLRSRVLRPHRAPAAPADVNFAEAGNWRGRVARLITRSMVPDEYLFWMRRVVKVGQRLAEERRVGAVLASFPTASAVVAGARLSREVEVPLVVDFRDPWDAYGPARGAGWLRSRVEQRILRGVLEASDAAVSVTASMLQQNLHGLDGDHLETAVIPHGWDPAEAQMYRHRERPSNTDGVLRVVNGGTIYPASDPLPLLEALKALAEEGSIDRTRTRIIFQGTMLVDVEAAAHRLGIADVVEVRGPVDRKDALDSFSRADALLVMRHGADRHFISAKIWDYLTVGRPVVAIASTESPIAKLVNETRSGWVVPAGDMAAIKIALKKLWSVFVAGQLEDWHPDGAALAPTSGPAIGARLGALLDELTSGPVHDA